MSALKTIKVKPWGKGQGDFVVINEGDFIGGTHQPLDAGDQQHAAHDKTKQKPKNEPVKFI